MNLPQGIEIKPHVYGLSYKGELVYVGIHNGNDKYYFSGGIIPNRIGRNNMIKGVIQYSDLKSLERLEVEYILKYSPKFNLTSGGDSSNEYKCKHSKETIAKRKKSFSKNINYLKELSVKTSKRNIENNPSIKHKIKCLNDNKDFTSIRDAARYYNIDNSYLSKHLKGKYEEVKGLKFIKLWKLTKITI